MRRRWRRWGERLLEGMDQAIRVVIPSSITHLERVVAGQADEFVWQFLGLGENGALHQDRYHENVASQRNRDLLAHQILGVIESTASVGAGRREPFLTYDDDHRLDCADRLVDQPGVIDAWSDRIDVHEHVIAEPVPKPIVKATCVTRAVLSPIADEDPGHGYPLQIDIGPNDKWPRLGPISRVSQSP